MLCGIECKECLREVLGCIVEYLSVVAIPFRLQRHTLPTLGEERMIWRIDVG